MGTLIGVRRAEVLSLPNTVSAPSRLDERAREGAFPLGAATMTFGAGLGTRAPILA